MDELASLQTEIPGAFADDLHTLTTAQLCETFNSQEALVSPAVAQCLPAVVALIDELVPRLRNGGRLIYVGAGSSGRIAYMDATELPVTFSLDAEQCQVVIAGGQAALVDAAEGTEDSMEAGAAGITELNVTEQDAVIAVCASGRTPFVLSAMEVAASKGALTAAITNVQPSRIEALVQHVIAPLVGPEFIAGSARLKAGSAAKQLLNMISTCAMVKLGKTYRGLMVDVKVHNEKLRARGRRIIRQVCGDCDADALMDQCGGSVKLACAVGLSGLEPNHAREKLAAMDGHLAAFIASLDPQHKQGQYFICIDGGGTKCAVAIASTDGTVVSQAESGACNINSVGLDEVMAQIKISVDTASAKLGHPRFAKAWVAVAGLQHSRLVDALARRVEAFLDVSLARGTLSLTCDASVLSYCMDMPGHAPVDGCVAVTAGTGAVAAAFKRRDQLSHADEAAANKLNSPAGQVGRAGGWGYLLGDDGSAFYIGKRALRIVLQEKEEKRTSRLQEAAAAYVDSFETGTGDVLATVLAEGPREANKRIAGLAGVVTRLAYDEKDEQALLVCEEAMGQLVDMVHRLTKVQKACEAGSSVLVLNGALMRVREFAEGVVKGCEGRGVEFRRVVVVDDVSARVAAYLARTYGPQENGV